ncbi:unnamed protein product [Rhizophagus irregularis]|uniref:DNA endonuclease activator Ctp1 C-terminal domain-containing protein n=1 Tax=Rhizophagus irregularis TaxID=588596 RepID=A0A915ZJ07_9GLOM|nr:unnamed protein product [Rhizophagus irregularis]CAB5207522.1 unnamed protein product [Rhizophagus irregularis]CAB5376935.1 unnamed protein product [Rhizophagus irregularis]
MQNSSNHKSASLDNTQENQTMSSKVGEGFVPTSMVQNILEWQSQALETIREQNKVNQVTQQQNNALLQRIDTLQQYIHNYKRDIDHFDAMDLDNTEAIGTVEDIKEDNQFVPETRGSSSNDALFVKDKDGQHISLRQSPDVETERRHKKALEDLDNEWRDKYAQLQSKYDAQYKAYQELKEHYQKRSAEWKRVKKWLDEQKFVQKNPERTDQVNELTSKMPKSKDQFEKSPTVIRERGLHFGNDSKKNPSCALADVTNMRNQSSPSQNDEKVVTNEHVIGVNRALTLGLSYNKEDNTDFRQNNNRSSHVLFSPNLCGSMITKNLDKMQTNYCPDSNPIYCDQEWNEDHIGQPNNSDQDMANVNAEEKDNLPSRENENLEVLEGTTPELPINLEKGNYEFLLDEEDPSSNKKRTADMVNMQENIEDDGLPSTEVTNKRCRPFASKQESKLQEELNELDEAFISDDIITKTPYNDRFKVDSKRSQTSNDNIYDNNDIDDANLLTPITPTSIRNKNVDKESNNKNNYSKQGEGYRYIETIRKKSERRQLMAQDCPDCRKYYEMTGISLSRQCDHNQSSETLVQKIGRHRAKYSRPQTPPGFWKVGFPTSQEIAEINELSVTYEREREEQKRKEMEFAKSRERKWDNGTSK